MNDLISRQQAIDALDNLDYMPGEWSVRGLSLCKDAIKALPPAQPEERTEERTETHACDCISRQMAIDIVQGYAERLQGYIGMPNDSEVYAYARGLLLSIDRNIKALPPAQPEHTNSCYTNSWCIDCKEYDTENKCCPRYSRIIKQTLDDAYMHGETEAEVDTLQ